MNSKSARDTNDLIELKTKRILTVRKVLTQQSTQEMNQSALYTNETIELQDNRESA